MSVLIKGMEMPINCDDCHFNIDCPYDESQDGYKMMGGRPRKCPLIEVPEPHGRLIDADALHKLFEDQWHYLQVLDWNENPTAEAMQSGINWCINTMHDDAPTIIPAEEG